MQEIKKITLYFFLTLFFIFLINIAFAPLHKMREFENHLNSDSLFLEKYDPLYNHPEMRLMVKEKIYKEALLKLAGSDSIQLVINLSDSTVNLSIKGVVIHQTKVRSFERDKIFSKMPLNQQVKVFSQPLQVQSQFATIVKEPIVIRQAPKDTLEAEQNAWQPDTLIQDPAFLILSAEYGIHLIFEQEDNPTIRDKWKRFGFYNRLRIKHSIQSLSNSVRFRKQDYHPTITIKMPADELRAVYRALPQNALIVINI
jgi:hypothetical protein